MMTMTVPIMGPTVEPELLDCGVVAGQINQDLPCRNYDPDLWFADSPSELGKAKTLCVACPIRTECLAGALARQEPWGVWGGEILERGAIVAFKRTRGRPRKSVDNTIVAGPVMQEPAQNRKEVA